ncbi:MAG: Organic hydroperoxide resistance protein [uncultured Actinomycetospora sp.]|uniref:Organic hydroperoxide resistance protein n=1 Tax=uncultured Actinomycetospora sp. TaxID=1135996 RepID=A0A6J4HUQ7_9PSEU|nr:MAG: Organic hydroperoxide resistance protein [uncultured Actinomycetospora sp.]
MKPLYTAVSTARGGREGEVTSDDGVLDLALRHPKELGGPEGDFTNPEQLFAAGYAACFHSALKRVAKDRGLDIEPSEITAKVTLGMGDDKAFGLAVTLMGALPTLDPPQGDELMQAAHQVCPYSRATRGNIEVTLELAPAPGA